MSRTFSRPVGSVLALRGSAGSDKHAELRQDFPKVFEVQALNKLERRPRRAHIMPDHVRRGLVQLEPMRLPWALTGLEEDEPDQRQHLAPLVREIGQRLVPLHPIPQDCVPVQ